MIESYLSKFHKGAPKEKSVLFLCDVVQPMNCKLSVGLLVVGIAAIMTVGTQEHRKFPISFMMNLAQHHSSPDMCSPDMCTRSQKVA